MMTVFSTVFKVIFTVTICASQTLAYDDCDAFYADADKDNNPGKCTPFSECPFLFDIIKNPLKTHEEIKLIQQLTCRKDIFDPYVCCSVEDIKGNNPKDYNVGGNKNSNSVEPNNDKIVFGQDPAPPKQNENAKNVDRTSAPHVKDHPNFKLLPSLRECSSNSFAMRIIGGNETSIIEYPWMARIGYYSLDEGDTKYLCAGTVINKRYILTAAHCSQEINPEEFEMTHVRIAEKDRECHQELGCHTPKDIKIEKVIPHPQYNKRDKSNDIGLIRLAEDIKFDLFTQPVCLPFVEEYGLNKDEVDPTLRKHMDSNNNSGWVAGWGKTRWNHHEGSDYLQHVVLPILSLQQCQKNYENHKRVVITDLQLCAGGEKNKDSCGGDSGGGLFVLEPVTLVKTVKVKKMFQYGVVSFGPTHCGVGGLPGVYSNVYKYKKWILDQLEP